MLKTAENLQVGDIVAFHSAAHRITEVRRCWDAVWIDIVPAGAPAYALDIPTRHDYGLPVAIAAPARTALRLDFQEVA